MAPSQVATIIASFFLASTALASLWVDRAPDDVRPYAIEHYAPAQALTIGAQTYRFPVTGASSGNRFSLLTTNAPTSGDLGVLPHEHELHHENFFCFKGRFQLWAHQGNHTEARLLTAGDYGSVPTGTTHTFQILAPDTELVGVIAPGKFEELFFFLATENVTYASQTPYQPAEVSASANPGAEVDIITQLESFDVHAQLNFTATRNLVNGTSPAGSVWHNGANEIPAAAGSPYFIAANWGPKYLSNETGSWHVVQPFVTPTTGEHNFTQGTITLSRRSANTSLPTWTLTDPVAFLVLEGSLDVTLGNESARLLPGDVVFIPGSIAFTYQSLAALTKFLYVSAGRAGLDQLLLAAARDWTFPVFPSSGA